MAAQNFTNLANKLIECFNKCDPNSFDTCMDTNVKYHDLAYPGKTKDLQALKNSEQEYVTAFPDKKTKIDSVHVAENDCVVVRWTTTGTHQGEYQGHEATNKKIKICGISIWRFSNNKLVEAWQLWDHLGLLEQLGVMQFTHSK